MKMGYLYPRNPYAVRAEVNTFANLPSADEYDGVTYRVLQTTGSRETNDRKSAGSYRSNGVDWEWIGELDVSDSDLIPDADKIYSQERIIRLLHNNAMRWEPNDLLAQVPINSQVWTDIAANHWMGSDYAGLPILAWIFTEKMDGANGEDTRIDVRLVDIFNSDTVVYEKLDLVIPNIGPNPAAEQGFNHQNITSYPSVWKLQIRRSLTGDQSIRNYRFYGVKITDTIPAGLS